MPERRWGWPLAGVACLLLWLGYEVWPRPEARPPRVREDGGRNVLLGTDPRVDDLSPLRQLGWADIAATLDGVGRDPSSRDRILAETDDSAPVPVRYLRGMLLLAKGDAAAAAAALAKLPAADIPPEHLYAPYRMYAALGRAAPNPFRDPIKRAVAAGLTPLIVTARVKGVEGDLAGALPAYLRTDPAQWTSFDLDLFGALRRHAGLAAETTTMIKAALRGGRVPAALAPRLIAFVSVEGERLAAAQLPARVAELMGGDAARRAPLVAAVETQLKLRQRFLRRDYSALLASHRNAVDVNLPDETLLLLVLSASHENVPSDFERWARELRRRFPDPSVAPWLHSLQPAASR